MELLAKTIAIAIIVTFIFLGFYAVTRPSPKRIIPTCGANYSAPVSAPSAQS